MRYLEEMRRDRVSYCGPFVTPETKAGRKLIRLWLRKYPWTAAPPGRAYVYVGSQDAWCGHVPLSRIAEWEPRSRTNCRTSFKCGCDGPIGRLADEQEKCYEAARRFRFTEEERRNAETMILAFYGKEARERERRERELAAAIRREKRRAMRLWDVRGPFCRIGSRSSARSKRRNILALGIPL